MIGSQKVVTPAKAGVQNSCNTLKYWIPAFAGMTENRPLVTLCELTKYCP